MKKLDRDNSKLEIYKDDGIYEINTQSLIEYKKTSLYYDYTLEKIKNEYFDKDLNKKSFRELYKDEEEYYYYFINNENIYIYSFNYLTKENKLIISTSKKLTEEDYEYSDDQIGIKLLGEYNGKKYVYIYASEGGIGTTDGRICCIDEIGNEKVLIYTFCNFVNYDVNENQLYIYIGDAVGGSKNYLVHMDTMNISNLEGYIEEEEDKESLLADKLMNIHLNTELKENLKSYFKIEDLRKQLNDTYNSANNLNEDIWDETAIKLTHRYECGYMYVYEYSIVVHGYVSWRGEYSRAGVVYFLVDTARHNVHEIYRVSLQKSENDFSEIY